MSKDDFPTDPNAETLGLPSDDSGKGSVPELGKFAVLANVTEVPDPPVPAELSPSAPFKVVVIAIYPKLL